MKSGFVSIVGRPNVGKSTLLNAILGQKVAITSDKPQTTRSQIRGVLNRPETQIVFVDTPGIHRPRTLLGERLNKSASEMTSGVDVVCLVVDATAPIGPGDRFVAEKVPSNAIVVVNKTDIASPDDVVAQLARAADQIDVSAYFFENRGLLHCEIAVPGWKQPLHCVNVHLGLLARGRRWQLRELTSHIRSLVPAGAPLVIAGDFNDWRKEDPSS